MQKTTRESPTTSPDFWSWLRGWNGPSQLRIFVRSSPAIEVWRSAEQASLSWDQWFARAHAAALQSNIPSCASLVKTAYRQGWKVFMSRVMGTEMFLRSPDDLRDWCRLQHWLIRQLDALRLRFSDVNGWPHEDDLLFSWGLAEPQFVEAIAEMDVHVRSGRIEDAASIAARYGGGFEDSRPTEATAAGVKQIGTGPSRIRMVGWDMMRRSGAAFRPIEPTEAPTWQTARRDLDLIEQWFDRPDVGRRPETNTEDAQATIEISEVAELVHLEPKSMSTHVKGWGDPKVTHKGRRKAQYIYKEILPIIRKQFPDTSFPDSWPPKH